MPAMPDRHLVHHPQHRVAPGRGREGGHRGRVQAAPGNHRLRPLRLWARAVPVRVLLPLPPRGRAGQAIGERLKGLESRSLVGYVLHVMRTARAVCVRGQPDFASQPRNTCCVASCLCVCAHQRLLPQGIITVHKQPTLRPAPFGSLVIAGMIERHSYQAPALSMLQIPPPSVFHLPVAVDACQHRASAGNRDEVVRQRGWQAEQHAAHSAGVLPGAQQPADSLSLLCECRSAPTFRQAQHRFTRSAFPAMQT